MSFSTQELSPAMFLAHNVRSKCGLFYLPKNEISSFTHFQNIGKVKHYPILLVTYIESVTVQESHTVYFYNLFNSIF